MGAVFDDGFGAVGRAFAAQIGHALLGDDDLDGVFAAVQMADQRNHGADLAGLGGGGTGEDGEEGVAGKVAGAADAVHHVAAQDMGAVDVAEDVHLQGGVDGEDAQTPDDFRVVGDFLRAKKEPGTEEIQILVDVPQNRIADGQRATAGEADFVVLDQRNDRVLNDLGVHVESGDFRDARPSL